MKTSTMLGIAGLALGAIGGSLLLSADDAAAGFTDLQHGMVKGARIAWIGFDGKTYAGLALTDPDETNNIVVALDADATGLQHVVRVDCTLSSKMTKLPDGGYVPPDGGIKSLDGGK